MSSKNRRAVARTANITAGLMPDYVKVSEFQEIAASIISYFNSPEKGITSRVKVAATAVEGGAGATETIVQITFKAELHSDWFTQIGVLAKILTENIGYQFRRKVSLAVKYEALLTPHYSIGLDVQCFTLRVGRPTEGKSWSRLDPEDLDTIR